MRRDTFIRCIRRLSNLAPSPSASRTWDGFISDLRLRGLYSSSFPDQVDRTCPADLENLPHVAYAGFDPTADSLHIGNLLIITNLLRCNRHGIRPIAVVGGATAAIGDPSGRTSERDDSNKDIVARNAVSIMAQVKQIAGNVGVKLEVINNEDWFASLSAVDFLRECKRIRVGEMLRMRAIKDRMKENEGISYTEFSYQTMQAYDWLQLAKRFDCFFQLGGSDQLGHLDLGAHFIKRRLNDRFAAGICLPLVTDTAGNKLGKSVGGGVWLSAERTSPFHFYQFFHQLHDNEAEKLFPQFSLRPLDEINAILEEHRKSLGRWVVQKELASELTQMVHGESGLEMALACSRALYQGSKEDIDRLDETALLSLFGNCLTLSAGEVPTFGDLADRTRDDKKQRGSTLMTRGAFKVNGIKEMDPSKAIDVSAVGLANAKQLTLICWGKRNFSLVKWI